MDQRKQSADSSGLTQIFMRHSGAHLGAFLSVMSITNLVLLGIYGAPSVNNVGFLAVLGAVVGAGVSVNCWTKIISEGRARRRKASATKSTPQP